MTGETKLDETETKLKRIATLSGEDSRQVFYGLMPHFNEEFLKENFHRLKRMKAVGVDRQTKEEYGKNLDENVRSLVRRMRAMEYKPGPVREVHIPKSGGGTRPLGISNFEDKIVQMTMMRVLEAIYEPLFHECSYGFRRGKGCHDAIKALHHHLYKGRVQTVYDVDLKNFFGTISHGKLVALLKMKIKDKRFIEYVIRMLKAGVLREGELAKTPEGTAQGSIVSPILANIFAHYAFDEWYEREVRLRVSQEAGLFRYADDMVICGTREDIERISKDFKDRAERFSLGINEDKSRIVPFDKEKAKEERQGTFDFLGFRFYIGESRSGHPIPKLKTSGKRMKEKLKRVRQWCKRNRDKVGLADLWKYFCIKVEGHIRYYGVSFNMKEIQAFHFRATRIFFKWMNRRSQKRSFNWEVFSEFVKLKGTPKPRICHRLF